MVNIDTLSVNKRIVVRITKQSGDSVAGMNI